MKNSFHFVRRTQIAIVATLIIASSTLFTRVEAAESFMISAANPLAAKAGYDILAKGGSAVDAAIATQLVLTLVEPQSSGIGGGAFMIHFNNRSKTVDTFDGREMAPANVKENHFLKAGGEPKKFYDAVVGGGAVGAPGAVAMLELAHKEYGSLPWSELFDAAIKLSEDGFAISPRLHFLLTRDKYLKTKSAAATYFYQGDGTAKPVGTVLKNPSLAHSLKAIAAGGAKAFYTGEIAQKIITAVQNDFSNPGLLTLTDLNNYVAKKRAPVCASYHAAQICGMGPPTSGGVTSLQILKLLENKNLASLKPGSLEAINLISEASALAFADRGKFLADADFVDVPVSELLDSGYIAKRSALISAGSSAIPYKAGAPSQRAGLLTPDDAIELPSTSHFSIVDGQGNAVSMTTSVENVFGSRLMAGGFILNNQLTDFSFRPSGDDGPVNNRIQPGKRPRSSMTPTIVLDEGSNLLLAIGSPGGSRIIGYVTKTIIGVLDWKLSIQDAVDFPHFVNRNGTLDLEEDTPVSAHKAELEEMGYKVKVRSLNSGLHGIMVTSNGLQGGADHRREGVVLGH
ncbi:MAG: gamma-glutamyltransferase [Sneathiella sp.]|nr:gamma-glutamyltransferase [Sneathiella sp.]